MWMPAIVFDQFPVGTRACKNCWWKARRHTEINAMQDSKRGSPSPASPNIYEIYPSDYPNIECKVEVSESFLEDGGRVIPETSPYTEKEPAYEENHELKKNCSTIIKQEICSLIVEKSRSNQLTESHNKMYPSDYPNIEVKVGVSESFLEGGGSVIPETSPYTKKEPTYDENNELLNNHSAIIKTESCSSNIEKSSSNQLTECHNETYLSDYPNIKFEVWDEGSVVFKQSAHNADLVKQELDIGPTELQPPDVMMNTPDKHDAEYSSARLVINYFPQGNELLLLRGEEFNQQPNNDLPMHNSPESLIQGMCGPVSLHDNQQPAHIDSSKQINANIIELLAQSSAVPAPGVPQNTKHRDNTNSTTTHSHGENISSNAHSKKFECNDCHKVFSHKWNLTAHIRVHTGEKPFECQSCGKRFSEGSNLRKHNIQVHSQEKPFECKSCSKRFIKKSGLTKHMRLHTVKRPFTCVSCGKSYIKKAVLIRHIMMHTGEKPFECKTCGKRFNQNFILSRHLRRVHSEVKTFECAHCSKRFRLKSSLTAHMRLHTGEKTIQCKTCGKRFSDKSKLTRHIVVHTGEKLFECKYCSKRLSTKYSLIAHMRVHIMKKSFEGESCDESLKNKSTLIAHMRLHAGEKPFECKYCGKTFNQNFVLTRHLFSHANEKPFDCKLCGKTFLYNAHLTSHMRVHSGERPFDCRSCDKRFINKSALTRHIPVHTGEKPFECESCGKRFNRSSVLTRHMGVHSGEKPFECETCGKKFRLKAFLTAHMRLHPGEKVIK